MGIKKKLLDFLEKNAGDYVIGLSKENVKLEVAKGNFSFKNLQLNAAALNQLRLPLNIHHGSIQEVSVDLSWGAAMSEKKPIKATVRGVYILVGPSDRTQWNKQEMRRRRLDLMKGRLQKAEAAARKALSKGDIVTEEKEKTSNSKAKKLPGFVKTIIDNLSVTISDIHIRYEDGMSQPGHSIAAGLTLDEFMIRTCTDAKFDRNSPADEQTPKKSGNFFSSKRRNNGDKHMIFKLCKLSQLAVYWDPNCVFFHSSRGNSALPTDMEAEQALIQNELESLISRPQGRESNESLKNAYILEPCDMTMTFTHNMRPPDSSKTASFKLKVEITSLDVVVDLQQTQQMLAMKQTLDRTVFYEKMFHYKPEESVSENPRAWWLYAYAFATKKYLVDYSSLMSQPLEMVHVRKRYIELYKKKLEEEETLQQDEVAELEECELNIPIQAIAMFRVQAEMLKSGKKKKKEDGSHTFSFKKDKYDDSDIEDEEVGKNLEHDHPIFEMTVDAGVTLSLSDHRHKIMFINVQTGMDLTIFPKNRIKIDAKVNDFEVKDEFTHNALYSFIAMRCPSEETSQKLEKSMKKRGTSGLQHDTPLFKLAMEKNPGLLNIEINAMPLEIRFNKDPILRLLDFMKLPPQTKKRLKSLGAKQLAAAKNAASKETISLKVQAFAPIIIIPVEADADKGVIKLDMGFVEIHGDTISESIAQSENKKKMAGSMAVTVVATNVKGDLALRKAHLNDDRVDTTFMKEFNVSVFVNKHLGPQGAPTFVELEVREPIIFTISPERLNKMMHVATSITTPSKRGKRRKQRQLFTNRAQKNRGGVFAGGFDFDKVVDTLMDLYSEEDDDKKETKSNDDIDPEKAKMELKIDVKSTDIYFVVTNQATPCQWTEWNVLKVKNPQVIMTEYPFQTNIELIVDAVNFEDLTKPENEEFHWILDDRGYVSADVSHPPKQVTILIALFKGKDPEYNKSIALEVSRMIIRLDPRMMARMHPFFEALLGYSQLLDDTDVVALYLNPLEEEAQETRRPALSSLQSERSFASSMNDITELEEKEEEEEPKTPSKPAKLHLTIAYQVGRLEVGRPKTSKGLFSFDLVGVHMDFVKEGSATQDLQMSVEHLKIKDIREEATSKVREFMVHSTVGVPGIVPAEPNTAIDKPIMISYKKRGLLENVGVTCDGFYFFLVFDTCYEAMRAALETVDCMFIMMDGDKEYRKKKAAKAALKKEEERRSAEAMRPKKAVKMWGKIRDRNKPPPEIQKKIKVKKEKVMNLELSCTRPSFYVLEKPSDPARALCMKFEAGVKLEKKSNEKGVVQEIQCSAHHFQKFIDVDIGVSSMLPISEPADFFCDVTKNVERDGPTSLGVKVRGAHFCLRLSYRDSMVLKGIAEDTLERKSKLLGGSAKEEETLQCREIDFRPEMKMLEVKYEEEEKTERKHKYTETVNVTLEKFEVVIVNDFQGQDQPVLAYKVSDIGIDLVKASGEMNLDLSVLMCLNFYNPQLMEFEPLLEDFQPMLKVKQDGSGDTITIDSDTPLQLNVSTELLMTMLETFNTLVSDLSQEGRENKEEAKNASIHFSNYTGLPVTLQLSQHVEEPIEVDSGKCVPINIQKNSGQKTSILDQDSYQTITLKFGGEMASSRQKLQGLQLYQHGSSIHQILPAKPSVRSKYLNSDPVLEETWEYEHIKSRQWVPHDKGQWLDKSMQNKRLKEDLSLPDSRWVWLDEWHVDDTHPLAEDGWTYGFRWSDLLGSDLDSHENTNHDLHQVRRRRWLRTRGPRPAPYNDPNRPFQMSWDNEVTHSGKISITARSLIRVKNCTSTNFEVKVSHVSESDGRSIGELNAQKELPVPLLDAYCSHLQVRPVGDGAYNWSSPALSIAQTPLTMEKVTIQCEPVKGNRSSQQKKSSFFFNADVNSVEKNIIVTIYPLIEVVNALPCNLKYRFSSDAMPQLDSGTLAPGETNDFKQIDMTDNPRLQIRIGRYSWSQKLRLLAWLEQKDDFDRDQFCLSNGEGQFLRLQASFSGTAKRTIRVEIYCKYWLVNKTGLPIDFGFRHEKIVAPKGLEVSEEEKTELSNEPLQVLHLQVKSKRHYSVDTLDNRKSMYTDKPFQWSKLPDQFRNQLYICTSFGDKNLKGEDGPCDFMHFVVSKNAVVYVLFDLHCKEPPEWLMDSGFVRTEEAIQTEHKGKITGKIIIDYQIWKQSFVARSSVRLGANNSAKVMYSVVIAPDHQSPTYDKQNSVEKDLLVDRSELLHDVDKTWGSGLAGMCLYGPQTKGNHEKIGLCIEENWSGDRDISKDVEKGIFEIHTPDKIYNLTLSSKLLPGVFHKSKMILVAPHYMIVNGLQDPILVRQVGTPEKQSTFIHPHSKENFHLHDQHQPKEVLLRVQYKTQWAFGSIKIGNVGVTPLHLPSRGGPPMVLHVQVALGKSSEECAVMVVVTQAKTPSQQIMRVRNDCRYPVRFHQEGAPYGSGYLLGPSKAVEFGWLYPAKKKVLLLSIDGLKAGQKRVRMDKLDTELNFVTSEYRATVVMYIEGTTKTIRIIEQKSQMEASPPAPTKKLELNLALKSVGVSIIVSGAQRREAFYVHIGNPEVNFHQNPDEDGIELKVQSFQLDNHIEGTLFPVLFASKPTEQDDEEASGPPVPFFHFSLVKATSKGTKSVFIRYLAFQITEFSIQVDRTTIEELLRIIAPLKPVSSDEAIASEAPHIWVNKLTSDLLESDRAGRLDVDQVIKSTQVSKLYFENLQFPPIKLNLTICQVETEAHNSHAGFNVLELLRNTATIENAHIRLKSFLVDHAVDGPTNLALIIGKHYALQLTAQVFSVLGSVSAFGQPADLLSGIGTGVKDFFYEPFHGAVQSPGKFVTGLGKGTTSLLQHTVGGTLQSAAGIGDGISRGIAYLSFDKDYTTERNKRMLELRMKKSGMKEGLDQAGSSLVQGFAQGFGGAFTKPITEAKKNGVPGFFAGVGMGAAGIVVKPVVGIADASMLVVQGLSNEVASEKKPEQIRSRRPLHLRSQKGGFILKPYLQQSADAQALVDLIGSKTQASFRQRQDPTASRGSSNFYHSDFRAGNSSIIFSEKLLIIKEDEDDPKLFDWTDFTSCHLDEVGLCLRVERKEGDPIEIPCPDEITMFALYSHFESKASKMLDSQSFVSLDDILAQRSRNASLEGAIETKNNR